MKSFSSIVYSLCSVCWYTLFGGKLDPGVTANCDSRSQRSPLSFVWARVMRNFELCWTLIIHWGGFCIHPFISFAGYHCIAMVVVLARVLWLVLWTITVTFVSSFNQYSPFQQCPVSGKSLLKKKKEWDIYVIWNIWEIWKLDMLKYLEIRCTYKNVLYNGNCINIAQKIRCTEMFYNDNI